MVSFLWLDSRQVIFWSVLGRKVGGPYFFWKLVGLGRYQKVWDIFAAKSKCRPPFFRNMKSNRQHNQKKRFISIAITSIVSVLQILLGKLLCDVAWSQSDEHFFFEDMLSKNIAEFVVARLNFSMRASFISVAASNGPKDVQLGRDLETYWAKEVFSHDVPLVRVELCARALSC